MNNEQLSQHLASPSTLPLSNSSELDCIRLSEHFHLAEFTRSDTAQRRGIDNTPSLSVVVRLSGLCHNVLEPLRRFANQPITISSGYRSKALNTAVGGVSNSQHMTGEAADIQLPYRAVQEGSKVSKVQDLELGKKWFEYLKTLPHDQLIWERDSPTSNHYWIHVSCRIDLSKNRNQCIPLLNKHSA